MTAKSKLLTTPPHAVEHSLKRLGAVGEPSQEVEHWLLRPFVTDSVAYLP